MESIASTTSSTDGTSQVDDRSPADRAAFQTASYVRPRPLPRRTPGATLTFRPLPAELADQGWDLRSHIETSTYDAVDLGVGEPAWKIAFGSAA